MLQRFLVNMLLKNNNKHILPNIGWSGKININIQGFFFFPHVEVWVKKGGGLV